MMTESVIIPAYVDEAGARGLVRDLKAARDDEFGILCAVLFDPDAHDEAIRAFTPPFERFRDAAPPGAKLHITDAFKAGNEDWRAVAEEVRADYLRLIEVHNPIVIYAARRLRVARVSHEHLEAMRAEASQALRSTVKVIGGDRLNDQRIEDDLVTSLAIMLDGWADWMAGQVHDVKQVDLLFDEIDIAKRYEALIQRTRQISHAVSTVRGWDMIGSRRVERSISMKVDAPFRLDTKFIGGIHVVGKAHPLVLAADIVANHLRHHLSRLPPEAPLQAPSSVAGWVLKERVWGVRNDATEDLV